MSASSLHRESVDYFVASLHTQCFVDICDRLREKGPCAAKSDF